MILIIILLWSVVLFTVLKKKCGLSASALSFNITLLISCSLIVYGHFLSIILDIPIQIFIVTIGLPILFIALKYKKYIAELSIGNILYKPTSYKDYIEWGIIFIFSILFFSKVQRWGGSDSWAIWSLHAKFLFNKYDFIQMMSAESIIVSHSDYPLFFSSLIALAWGSTSYPVVFSAIEPILISYLICIILIKSMWQFALQRDVIVNGIFLLLIMCVLPLIYYYGISQLSDTLLSLFILISIILINENSIKSPYKFMFMGFISASAGWIKNEGLIFFVIYAFFTLIVELKNIKNILYFFLGILIPLSIIGIQKIGYAPPNDMTHNLKESITVKLFDISRYYHIIRYTISFIKTHSIILFIVSVMTLIFNYKYYFSKVFLILFSTFCAYILVYVLTPHNLDWHLSTSLGRLLHHITPALMMTMLVGQKDYLLIAYHNIKNKIKSVNAN